MHSYWYEAVILCVVAELVLLTPVLRYIHTGWRAKRRDIIDGLDESACQAYFDMFCRTERPTKGKSRQAFFDLYFRWYGRSKFVLPLIELFLVSTLAITSVALSLAQHLGNIPSPMFPLDLPAAAALSGAYMWICNDLIARSRRLDLAPSDLQWGSMRLLICIPMGYAFGYLATEAMAPFLAFALGAFPIEAITNMLRRTVYRTLKIDETVSEATDSILKLQGTDRAIVERLANEDLHTVAQMAYCDPVHTTMRSNLSFNFVTDLMGQSLAWLYFRDQVQLLSPYGLRGAVQIRRLVCELDEARRHDGGDQDLAVLPRSTLARAAAALQLESDALEFTFRQIAEDPYTRFLFEIWADPRHRAAAETPQPMSLVAA